MPADETVDAHRHRPAAVAHGLEPLLPQRVEDGPRLLDVAVHQGHVGDGAVAGHHGLEEERPLPHLGRAGRRTRSRTGPRGHVHTRGGEERVRFGSRHGPGRTCGQLSSATAGARRAGAGAIEGDDAREGRGEQEARRDEAGQDQGPGPGRPGRRGPGPGRGSPPPAGRRRGRRCTPPTRVGGDLPGTPGPRAMTRSLAAQPAQDSRCVASRRAVSGQGPRRGTPRAVVAQAGRSSCVLASTDTPSRARSASRARASRLFTVPSGSPSVAAIASHDSPSTSRRSRMARWAKDSDSSACLHLRRPLRSGRPPRTGSRSRAGPPQAAPPRRRSARSRGRARLLLRRRQKRRRLWHWLTTMR